MRKKLMIVERDSDILFILTHIFEQQGYTVTAFDSEAGVLERIKTERPDAVVLDIMQPTPAGTELCREIKASDEIRDTPVIALSTHIQASRIHDICADKVLGKPFDITELLDAVESQVQA